MDLGITAGFGGKLGLDLLAQIKAHGYTRVRNGVMSGDAAKLKLLTDELFAARIDPVLGVIVATQLSLVPAGVVDVELRATVDTSTSGAEPFFTRAPHVEAADLNAVASIVRAKQLRAWVGMTGTNADDLRKLAAFVRVLDPVYGISIHRYPPKGARSWTASYLSSRDEEGRQLKTILDGRPFAVCEVGYSQVRQARRWQRLFGYHWHLSDTERAACLNGESAYWRQLGAQFMCVFQLNDGKTRCRRHPQYPDKRRTKDGEVVDEGFGARRSDESWKPIRALGL